MGIVRKFTAALGSMLALILFVAAIGFAALHVLEKRAGEIVVNSMRMQRLALEVDSRLQLARQAERDFILHVNNLGMAGSQNIYAAEFNERINEAEHNVAGLQAMDRFDPKNPNALKSAVRLTELREALKEYANLFRETVKQAARSGTQNTQFERKTGELDGEYLHLTSQVRQLAISTTDAAHDAHKDIAHSSLLVEYLLILSVLLALLLAASIIWVLNRTVAKNAVRLNDTAMELSLGNLEARAEVKSNDEFGQLATSINSMAKRITTLVNGLEKRAATASDRLEDAIDSISEGFLLYDRNGRLLLINRKFKEIIGDAANTLLPGVTVDELLRVSAMSGSFINAIGREEEWVAKRLSQHKKNGQQIEEALSNGRWMLLKTYQTGRGEVVIIMSDITERKQRDLHMASMNSDLEDLVRERTKVLVEKALELKKANERLRELDELKSAFLSSVSHELRTPLTSLLGFAKIIKRDFTKDFVPLSKEEGTRRLATRIQSNLDIISSEGERLTRLINDVLDLSRIESGREDWKFIEVDMAEAVHRAMDSACGLFSPNPQVKLILRRMETVPSVLADPDRLHQVLINLLSNAAKFTEYGEVFIDLHINNRGQVRLTVEDTGKGIAPQFIEQIFDKFQQAQHGDTLTEKPAGTGLGLAICRQIIESYGGRIWAESTLGRGTRICINLPAFEHEKPLILVVDDDPAARDYLSLILKKAGYLVCTAHDGQEALTMATSHPPALITMDILMPCMDGYTAIHKLRQNSALATIPILVVSVTTDCHCAGGDAALLKPVDREALLETVSGLLGNKTSNSPVLALKGHTNNSDTLMTTPYNANVIDCSESELWEWINKGFKGTILIPDALSKAIDLPRLCTQDCIQVLLIPTNSAQIVN